MRNNEMTLKEFEAEHGLSVWRDSWGYCPDGSEIEFSALGFRFLDADTRSPDKVRTAKTFYWRYRLEDLTEQFRKLKRRLRGLSENGLLRPADVAHLQALEIEVENAAANLARAEQDGLPDEHEIENAIKLYYQREALLEALHDAEA